MLVLKFDYMKMGYDLCDVLVDAVNEIMNHFMFDVRSTLKATDYEVLPAEFDESLQRINAECVFYAHSIIESYGTGSRMDINNEALLDYIGSKWWNPSRWSLDIVGRPLGSYLNIFGEKKESRGTREWKRISGGIEPSYAIQNAEKELYGNGYVMRTLQGYARNFFDTVDKSKYFHNEDVKT